MKFSRQEYWSRLPFPPLGDLPNPGTEPETPALQADSLPSESPWKAKCNPENVFILKSKDLNNVGKKKSMMMAHSTKY